ncbi:4777_t:CDS:1, partial [Entrophospora sp. SA101]
ASGTPCGYKPDKLSQKNPAFVPETVSLYKTSKSSNCHYTYRT